MCLRHGILAEQWIVWRTVVLLEDQFCEYDAVIPSVWAVRIERKGCHLTRHNTLPVSPFLLLSEVGSWASSVSITTLCFRGLVLFELFF